MNKRNWLSVVFILLTITSYAGFKPGRAYFYGSILSDQSNIELVVRYFPDYLHGAASELREFRVPVNKNGSFSFALICTSEPGRLMLMDKFSGVDWDRMDGYKFVESGDSIKLNIQIKDGDWRLKASGRGAVKYNCFSSLAQFKMDDSRDFDNNYQAVVAAADSIKRRKLAVLNKYRSSLTHSAYELFKIDILSENTDYKLTHLFSSGDSAINVKYDYYSSLRDDLFETLNSDLADEKEFISYSTRYIQLMYGKATNELLYTKEVNHASGELYHRVDFAELYNRLKDPNVGLVREKLLLYCITDNVLGSFLGEDAEVYTNCLRDAVDLIKTPYLKKRAEQELFSKGKGSMAFNFNLPKDSTGMRFNLSELKGKVVLLDAWGYICGGCERFANIFHHKVYPLFKDNPEFAVVSIMMGNTKRDKYLKRIRPGRDLPYTFPQYINLYGGFDEKDGKAMFDYYNIQGFPFILLIDRKGRIYSSTIPFFDHEEDSPNVQRLCDLIKKALNEIE